MPDSRPGNGIVSVLIACLTAAILLLGVELALAIKEEDRLSREGTVAVAAVSSVLYAAISWRSAQERQGLKSLAAWWGTMLGAHGGLGLLIGFFHTALTGASLTAHGLLQWAGGMSLPLGVLQVGYAVGISAIAYGDGRADVPVGDLVAERTIESGPCDVTTQGEQAVCGSSSGAHLQVYVAAIDRLRASDVSSLLRFAVQAARCDGALLTDGEGQVVAAVDLESGMAARLAEALPALMAGLKRLGGHARPGATMLHAAFAGYDILAASGVRLIACLVGPQPGSRDIAEVMLPVLVARAEGLTERVQQEQTGHPTEARPEREGDEP